MTCFPTRGGLSRISEGSPPTHVFLGGTPSMRARDTLSQHAPHARAPPFHRADNTTPRYVTVIPDYRLLPDMKWPDPATDVRDALVYVVEHFSARVDTSNIFLLGHSAGGAIIADVMLMPGLLPERVRACIRGIAPFGAILHHGDVQPRVHEIFAEYYAGEDYRARGATGLLGSAPDDFVLALPDILVIVSEFDVPGLMNGADAFLGKLQERGRTAEKYVAAKHNHASPLFGLFMGDGEDWAYYLDQWFKARILKPSV